MGMSDPNPLWHRYLRFWERDPRADLDEELAHHLQARIDEYTAAGMNEDEAHTEAERRLGDIRRVMVVSQIALALVLASGAGLLVRSFVNALRVEPGFEPARLLSFQVMLPAHRYPDGASVARAERQLIDALASVPGAPRRAGGSGGGAPVSE